MIGITPSIRIQALINRFEIQTQDFHKVYMYVKTLPSNSQNCEKGAIEFLSSVEFSTYLIFLIKDFFYNTATNATMVAELLN
jgi:hypothetical protein